MVSRLRLTPIKEYPSTLKASLIFLLTLLGILVVLSFIPNFNLVIPVNVQEMGNLGVGFSFSFPFRNLIKIILLSLFHGTISYFIFKKLYIDFTQSQLALNISISPFKKRSMEIILLWIIVTLMMGNVLHWLCDRANWLYRDGSSVYSTDDAFLLIYYADEYLSHAMIHISYLALLVFGVYCELGIQPRRKINRDESILVIGLTFGIVVVNGEAARQGESALLLCLLSLVVVIGLIIMIMLKKLKLLEYPLMCILLFGSIGVIVYDLILVLFFNAGLPYYPYIT